MIGETASLIASGKSLMDFGKVLLDVRDTHKIQALKNQFMAVQAETLQSLNAAQGIMLTLHSENEELRKQIRALEALINEKSAYTRKEIITGHFAYVSNEPCKSYLNAHKYCCNCYDQGVKSTLECGVTQYERSNHVMVYCHTCKSQFSGSNFLPVEQ